MRVVIYTSGCELQQSSCWPVLRGIRSAHDVASCDIDKPSDAGGAGSLETNGAAPSDAVGRPAVALALDGVALSSAHLRRPVHGTIVASVLRERTSADAPRIRVRRITPAGDVVDMYDVTLPTFAADAPADVERRTLELQCRLLVRAAEQVSQPAAASRSMDSAPPRTRARAQSAAALAFAKSLIALLFLFAWRPIRDALRTLRRRHPVRFFTFHRVTTLCRDGMTVSPDVFRRQLEYIKRHSRVVTLEEALRLLATGARLDRPAAVITFDDAYRSVVDQALPVMQTLAIPGACFVTTGLVGTDQRFPHDVDNPACPWLEVMDWNELMTLRRAGWTIGAHTVTHARLSHCTAGQLATELEAPLAHLAERLAVRGVTMSYPFGGPADISPAITRRIAALGYDACFSDYGGDSWPDADRFHLPRMELGGDHAPLAWMTRVHGFDLADLRHLLPFPIAWRGARAG